MGEEREREKGREEGKGMKRKRRKEGRDFPLSNPAVRIAGREPTKGPCVHYCYSTALQNSGEYAENRLLLSIIYGLRPHKHTVYKNLGIQHSVQQLGNIFSYVLFRIAAIQMFFYLQNRG